MPGEHPLPGEAPLQTAKRGLLEELDWDVPSTSLFSVRDMPHRIRAYMPSSRRIDHQDSLFFAVHTDRDIASFPRAPEFDKLQWFDGVVLYRQVREQPDQFCHQDIGALYAVMLRGFCETLRQRSGDETLPVPKGFAAPMCAAL